MKLVIALNFMLLSIIMMGLFLITRSNYGRLGQSSKYWSIAIVCDSLGLGLMGALILIITDFNQSSFLGTVSNTLLFASIVYQAISIRALNTNISQASAKYILACIILFGVVWDYARFNVDTNTRVMFFAVFAFATLVWQLMELNKHKVDANQIRIIRYLVIAEICFVSLRFFAVAAVSTKIVHVEELPVLGLFALWVQYGLKVVVYCGLVAYWSEDLAKQKAKAELESQEFKALSERQEALIADLGRLNKAATAGVLAASIAHELSQPLQSLVLNIGLSLDEMRAEHPDRQFVMDTLQEQSVGVARMAEVINTMRGVFTEEEAREVKFDLFETINRLTVLVSAQAQKRGIHMEYQKHGEAFILVRPPELQQVLLNLLGNAFDALIQSKTTAPQIRVTVGHEGSWVACSVEDNGPGIDPAMHSDMFKFLKTTKSSGMGLGLWLCKYIVERNHGQIFATRSELGGAKFTIKLPAYEADPMPVQ